MQETAIHKWNLAKTGLNKNNGSENPLLSYVYGNNFKLNSNISDTSLKESKQALRSAVSKKRSSLSKEFIAKSSGLICKKFFITPFYKLSKNIALYYPIKNEVNPLSIFEYSINSDKNILFPKMEWGSLVFHKVKSLDDFTLNKYGVYEPGANSNKVEVEDIELFIIPGLAFDIKGNRLGYGKGCYDKVLNSVSSNKIVGFCYYFQIFNFLPSNVLDKKVGFLASEEGVLSCKF